MLKLLLICGGAALALKHLRCRFDFGDTETGRLYRSKETIALPKCQRCGRAVRRPLVVLRDDESEREVYLGPSCAAIVLRTQEDVPEVAPSAPEADIGGTSRSCCDVDYDQWKNDSPIDYKTARDALHQKQRLDAERGRYWNVTHAMTLQQIGRNKKRRWRECLAGCNQRMWQGDTGFAAIAIEVRGDDEVAVITDPPMTVKRSRGAWLLLDGQGLTLSRHSTRDAALREAQATADVPF